MKRLLTLMVTLVALATAIAPSTASAWPSNLPKYGISLRGADIGAIQNNSGNFEFLGASLLAPNGWHVRGSVSYCNWSGNHAAYDSVIGSFVSSSVNLLPILSVRDCNGNVPSAANITAFAQDMTTKFVWIYGLNGKTWGHVIEVENEPNCSYSSLDSYWNSTYVPAFTGIRNADQTTNVLPGGLATTNASNCVNGNSAGWIQAIHDRGYSSSVNAYALHAYGAKLGGGTRQSNNVDQEFDAACAVADRKILVTETGHPSGGELPNGINWTEAAQQSNLVGTVSLLNGDGAKAITNWPGQDQKPIDTPGQTLGSSGLYRTINDPDGAEDSGKPALSSWIGYGQSNALVGDLPNTHC